MYGVDGMNEVVYKLKEEPEKGIGKKKEKHTRRKEGRTEKEKEKNTKRGRDLRAIS